MALLCQKKELPLAAFAVLCLLLAVSNGFTSERPLLEILPKIPFEAVFKMRDFFIFASFIAVANLVYQLKKGLLSLKTTKLISSILRHLAPLRPCPTGFSNWIS